MKQIEFTMAEGDDAWAGWKNAVWCAVTRAARSGRRQQVRRSDSGRFWLVQEIR